jgi:hypothetical protein
MGTTVSIFVLLAVGGNAISYDSTRMHTIKVLYSMFPNFMCFVYGNKIIFILFYLFIFLVFREHNLKW